MAEPHMTTAKAWEELIARYSIEDRVRREGAFSLSADMIREYREPRLMAKWDSDEFLPKPLKSRNLNILPVSRSSYLVSDVKLYEPLPEAGLGKKDIQFFSPPVYESIDIEHISSESNAINALKLSGILEDFLGGEVAETFNGRMGSGEFSFQVDRCSGDPLEVDVKNAQLEIDAGFETQDSVVIMEAKNVPHSDFLVRQLYYPYRLWREKVNKPIRLIFSQYTNQIYRLFEFEFKDKDNYSSIHFVRESRYSLQSTVVTLADIDEVLNKTSAETDDRMDDTDVPFIQADLLERVIAIMERLARGDMEFQQIAELMSFDKRQAYYYASAGRYLNLFEYSKPQVVSLTARGREIFNEPYRERQLALVSQIFKHEIFRHFYKQVHSSGKFPSKTEVVKWMRQHNVCGASQLERRAGSVLSWLKWVYQLTECEDE